MSKTNQLQKHTLLFFEGDYEKVQNLYPDTGAAVIIRHLLRNFLKQIEEGDTVPSLAEGVQI